MSHLPSRFRSWLLFAIFAVLIFPGCFGSKDEGDPIDQVGGEGTGTLISEGRSVPLPSPDEIKQLGAENDLDLRWLFSDGFQASFAQPKRFLGSKFGKSIAYTHQLNTFCASSCVFFQGIPIDFESADNFLAAVRLDPYEIQVTRKGERLAPQVGWNQSSVLVVNYSNTFTPEQKLKEMYPFLDNVGQLQKSKIEEYEFYVLLQDDYFPDLQKFLYFPPDGKTLVFFTGTDEAFGEVLKEKTPKGALVERLRRVDLANTDMTMMATIEGTEGLAGYLDNWLGSHPVLPQEMKALLVPSMRALSLNINASAPEKSPAVTVVFDLDSAKNADEIAKLGRSLAISFQTDPANSPEAAGDDFRRFQNSVVYNMEIASQGSKVNITIPRFPEMSDLLGNIMIGGYEREVTLRRLSMLAAAMNAYHEKNGSYPSKAITAEDGTPLLSWRVQLLQFMGDEEMTLYKQFNLSEPWDGPTNRPLLDKMPFVFAYPVTKPAEEKSAVRPPLIPGNMTTYRLFSSPGTPFANPQLKVTDLKLPNNTIMLVSVTPENAVEWTKPDMLALEEDKIYELLGGMLTFVLFNGYSEQGPFPNTSDAIHQIMHAITGTEHGPGE